MGDAYKNSFQWGGVILAWVIPRSSLPLLSLGPRCFFSAPKRDLGNPSCFRPVLVVLFLPQNAIWGNSTFVDLSSLLFVCPKTRFGEIQVCSYLSSLFFFCPKTRFGEIRAFVDLSQLPQALFFSQKHDLGKFGPLEGGILAKLGSGRRTHGRRTDDGHTYK